MSVWTQVASRTSASPGPLPEPDILLLAQLLTHDTLSLSSRAGESARTEGSLKPWLTSQSSNSIVCWGQTYFLDAARRNLLGHVRQVEACAFNFFDHFCTGMAITFVSLVSRRDAGAKI